MSTVSAARGWWLGLAGVLTFSLTLPMTRIAVRELDPFFVGLGRSLISAVIAVVLLRVRRDSFPAKKYLAGLVVTSLCVVVAFPIFISLALREVPAAHGAVVTGVLPLTTAIFARWRAHEKPAALFWISSLVGSATVVGYLLFHGGWSFHAADVYLLLAVTVCACGYVEGGRLAREIGGWRVISWAVIFALPAIVPLCAWSVVEHGLHASARAWSAFAYTGVFSMFFGMWAWYVALSSAGVARVSQIQLLQPFLSLLWAGVMLGEALHWHMLATALVVLVSIVLSRRAKVAAPKFSHEKVR